MAELAQWELTTGRAHEAYLEDLLVRLDEARAGVAAVIHADIDAVALTHGTTDGINAALWSIDWQPGDTLVTTGLEYPAVVAAMRNLGERRDVEVRVVDVSPADDDVTIAGAGTGASWPAEAPAPVARRLGDRPAAADQARCTTRAPRRRTRRRRWRPVGGGRAGRCRRARCRLPCAAGPEVAARPGGDGRPVLLPARPGRRCAHSGRGAGPRRSSSTEWGRCVPTRGRSKRPTSTRRR